MSICCASVQAQTAGGDHDTIRTVAGALTISKVEHMAGDGVAGHVDLGGKRFDELYGSRHMYYPELDDKSGAISRMVMEDFSGGFSDPPSTSLYDFRRTPPAAVPISSKLDIDDVRWQPGTVLLHAGDKWYTFATYKLKSTKIMAIAAGAAEGMAETAKALAKAWTGAFNGAGGIAFILTIGLDVAEWYHDYEQINPDGTRGKGLADLVAKVGIDIVAAGISSILGVGVYYLLTTALTGFGVAVGGWVALVVIGVTAFLFYVIGVADNHYLYTKKAAGLTRKAMRYLEKTCPKDYDGYPMIVAY